MSCTDFEIRDYFLDELPEADKRQAARHLASCSRCAHRNWRGYGIFDSLWSLFPIKSRRRELASFRIKFSSHREPAGSGTDSGTRVRGWASLRLRCCRLRSCSFAMRPAPVVRFVERPAAAHCGRLRLRMQPVIDAAVRKAVAETELHGSSSAQTNFLAVAQRKYRERPA